LPNVSMKMFLPYGYRLNPGSETWLLDLSCNVWSIICRKEVRGTRGNKSVRYAHQETIDRYKGGVRYNFKARKYRINSPNLHQKRFVKRLYQSSGKKCLGCMYSLYYYLCAGLWSWCWRTATALTRTSVLSAAPPSNSPSCSLSSLR
jgi:hypothetical protein